MAITKSFASIHITDLALEVINGCNEWERTCKQKIILNIKIEFDQKNAVASDSIRETVDYRAIKNRIIDEASSTSYFLLETLTDRVLQIVMESPLVTGATVRIDKPHALSHAESVSIEMNARKEI
jgi:D-erythro-7,8-dihydroneopterin triphosphate epimerase